MNEDIRLGGIVDLNDMEQEVKQEELVQQYEVGSPEWISESLAKLQYIRTLKQYSRQED